VKCSDSKLSDWKKLRDVNEIKPATIATKPQANGGWALFGRPTKVAFEKWG